MAFSAGRRRVASPFARRAEEYANKVEDTPDISNIPNTAEPESKAQTSDAPESTEKHTEPSVESNNQDSENDASDEVQEPTSDEVPADKPVRGRGRPRPAEVKERDERVLVGVIAQPGSNRQALEDALGLTQNEVYMSLFRLRKEGKIEKRREGGKHAWYAVEA